MRMWYCIWVGFVASTLPRTPPSVPTFQRHAQLDWLTPSLFFFFWFYETTQVPGGVPTGAKIIVVTRNPFDTAVSLFHHTRDVPVFNYNGR